MSTKRTVGPAPDRGVRDTESHDAERKDCIRRLKEAEEEILLLRWQQGMLNEDF